MPDHPLAGLLRRPGGPVLVLVDDLADPGGGDSFAAAPRPDEGHLLGLSQVGEKAPTDCATVLLVTRDRLTLRRLASALPRAGVARRVAVWLHGSDEPLVVAPRPEWPPVGQVVARRTGSDAGDDDEPGALVVLRFRRPAKVRAVLLEACRQAVPWAPPTHAGVVLGYAARPAAPGLDPTAVLVADAADAGDAAYDEPPDVVVASRPGEPAHHHVIDRAPTVVTDPPPDPVDEAVVNPIGWRRDWEAPVADLAALDLDHGVTELDLPRLRRLQGVRVPLGEAPTRTVAALAMAGVPLLATGADRRLGPELSAALGVTADLDDRLAREEHSLRVRRAALRTHSTLAWRTGLARRAGVRVVAQPTVSVLLATKREHQLDFALRQLARQRDVHLEVVLAPHGFTVDPARVADALGGRPHRVLEHPEETFFGDVLDSAARAASGDVLLKVDDDDWYSPHLVADLLLARRYSGADVVGTPAEFVWLEEAGVTVRRREPSETWNRFVAGGTLSVSREVLREMGGFRAVRRFVDAQLLHGVEAAGLRTYRAHGLGYVLRRTGSGHTWHLDPEEFRDPAVVEVEWPGFRPSAELEVDPRDVPAPRRTPSSGGA